MPDVKDVIDATERFPSLLLDAMVQQFLGRNEADELWLVLTKPEPVGVAYVAPQNFEDGIWTCT